MPGFNGKVVSEAVIATVLAKDRPTRQDARARLTVIARWPNRRPLKWSQEQAANDLKILRAGKLQANPVNGVPNV